MHSWNSPWQWGSWKVRLANAEGAVSRQYQCSHWSLCLLNIQAFLPASSTKKFLSDIDSIGWYNIHKWSNQECLFHLPGGNEATRTTALWGLYLPDTLPCIMVLDRFTPLTWAWVRWAPGTLECQVSLFHAFSPFLVPRDRGVPGTRGQWSWSWKNLSLLNYPTEK